LTTSAKLAKPTPAAKLPLTHQAPKKLLSVTVARHEITLIRLRGHFSIHLGGDKNIILLLKI
jgi:hypothetical protein